MGCYLLLFKASGSSAFAPPAFTASTTTRRWTAADRSSSHQVLQDYRSDSDISPEHSYHDTTTTSGDYEDEDASAFSLGGEYSTTFDSTAFYKDYYENAHHREEQQQDDSSSTMVLEADPARIGFVFPETPAVLAPPESANAGATALSPAELLASGGASNSASSSYYPFAAMMQGSAPYIADHAGKVIVFYLPGELLDDTKASDALLQDIALCWLLDMKIVIVTGTRLAVTSECSLDHCPMEYSHECHNSLKRTDRATLRLIEEDAGFLRTEMERKLNKCLRAHGGTSHSSSSLAVDGNVVSGNFYTAQRFGEVRGEDFEYTGFASETHTENILQVLKSNDVVLLSTVGLSPMGELVNVNGYHLAATVAASLKASKLIYLSNKGCLLKKENAEHPIQELPMSLAQSITEHHNVKCHNTGFATFQKARSALQPAALELLLHLGWSAWAVDRGVGRSHIVNPGDGALLEELFTSKNGANTCLFHDSELEPPQASTHDDVFDGLDEEWDDFFATAQAAGQRVAFFG